LLGQPGPAGTIIVSTQVIEAGVDVSARTLFTELAPWSSLVQRFGRCNRNGEYEDAEIFWIDLPTGKQSLAPPYTDAELEEARTILQSLEGRSAEPDNLPTQNSPIQTRHVLRRKDIVELFDTTPDLTGHDTDISRFIRESNDLDIHVFWRALPDGKPRDKDPLPSRDELCPAPITEVRDLVKGKKSPFKGWYWDPLEDIWSKINPFTTIYPGMSLLLDANTGHYSPEEGWNKNSKEPVPVIPLPENLSDPYESQASSEGDWETIAAHTDRVLQEMNEIVASLNLPGPVRDVLLDAARWHDAGKAHPAFQAMIKPEELAQYPGRIAAKAPRHAWKGGRITRRDDERRKFFRHELASGILALQQGKPDLVAYLAAAHHGKVRLSIRSMPDEFLPPDTGVRFARGVWNGDMISSVDLGGDVSLPETTIDLSYMDLGEGSQGPSWLARMLALRDKEDLGIFRLAYMEALMKAADERASRGRP
jgi:CRISPR-associated endonuclease/helicase Cas3